MGRRQRDILTPAQWAIFERLFDNRKRLTTAMELDMLIPGAAKWHIKGIRGKISPIVVLNRPWHGYILTGYTEAIDATDRVTM